MVIKALRRLVWKKSCIQPKNKFIPIDYLNRINKISFYYKETNILLKSCIIIFPKPLYLSLICMKREFLNTFHDQHHCKAKKYT